MSTSHIAAPAFLLAALVSPLAAGITFKPLRAQAGESIRLVTHSETDGGTIQQSFSGKVQNGSISVTRDRELIWTFRNPSPDGTRRGMVRVPGISTTTETVINGKEDKKTDTSPLSGKMLP